MRVTPYLLPHMERKPSFLERVGQRVTRTFRPQHDRAASDVIWQDLFTTGARAAGLAGPPRNSRIGVHTYASNPWVFGAFNAIVNDAAEVPVYIRKKVRVRENGMVRYEYKKIEEHQALDLMKHPMPDAEALGTNYMNGDLFTRNSMLVFLGSGEFMWRINQRLFGQIPLEMQMMYPHCTDMNLNRYTGLIESYTNHENGAQEVIDPWDVVHVKTANPANLYRGLSQIMAADVAIQTERESDTWLFNWFKNRAIPEFILSRENAPKAGEVERFKVAWNEEHGGSENAGKMAVVWGGEIKQVGYSQREMQHKELKEYNRDTILASLRLSPAGLGMMQDANRASVEAFDYALSKRVVKPFLTMYYAQLTSEFLSRFPQHEGMEFCFDNPVPEDTLNKATVWTTLQNGGNVSIDEIRRSFNLEPYNIKGLTDIPLVALGKAPLTDLAMGLDDAPDEEPEAEGVPDEDTDE